jgi:hypothetical protein
MFPEFIDADGDIENFPLGYPFERLLDICRKNDVHRLDSRPVFANINPVSELRVNESDGHPSAFANRLAADAILQAYSDQW